MPSILTVRCDTLGAAGFASPAWIGVNVDPIAATIASAACVMRRNMVILDMREDQAANSDEVKDRLQVCQWEVCRVPLASVVGPG